MRDPGRSPRLASGVCALALAGLAAGAGCARRETSAPAAWRWIERPPVHALAASELREVDCARRWEFPDGQLGAGLELVEGARIDSPGGGLTVRGGNLAPRLAVTAALPAQQAEALRVVVGGVRRGQVTVRWRGAAGTPAGELALHRSAGTGAVRDRFLFDLRAEDRGRGPLRLEILPTSAAGEIVTVAEICIGRVASGGARLAAVAGVPWKVRVGDDTRDALVVPAAGAVERAGQLQAGSRLEFGVAIVAGGAAALRVTVEARGGAAAPRTLFERHLEGAAAARAWIDLAADLGAESPGPAELALRVEPESPSADFVAAVSSPRVSARGRPDPRPNLVLISIDTLRADRLSLYGYERPTSPHLDAWAREHAVVFRRAVAPSSWTLPSHFSLFTGVDGFAHPANHDSIALDATAYRFLAEELQAAGYRTRAITGGAFLSPDYGLARGFESYVSWAERERWNEELEAHLARAGELLDAPPGEPFFLFFHTYEVHTPNPPREPWFTRFHGAADERVVDLGRPAAPSPAKGFLGGGRYVLRTPGRAEPEEPGPADAALPSDAYDSAVAFVDDRLAPLLERLVRPPYAGRTVVAVVSDHGESLGEEGRAGHNFLTLDNLLVPLVLVVPGESARGREVAAQVRLHDLYATLLEYAGLAVPEGVDARSLAALARGAEERGRLALSYVATTNYGMSLITPDGLKLEWRNSPWRALAGVFDWSRVEDLRERRLAEPPPGPEAARWRQRIQDAYAQRAPGLRLEVSQRGSAEVGVEVVTELIDPVTVKTPGADSIPIDWLDVGRLRAALPAGRALRLHFERIARRELAVAVALTWPGCAEPAREALHGTPEQLRAARVVRVAAPACAGGDGAGPVEIRLLWQGPVPSSAWRPADEELQESLRALGYLN
ncbi:MAG: sulfatase [Acidobacteria bacterium]|nr:sulfatase [Acidobacteriota bacterium]